MPYIKKDKRDYLDPHIDKLHEMIVDLELDDPDFNNTEGNMNYVFTRLLHMVYGDKDSTSYAQINDVRGLLGCVKDEYYRKVAAPYEDKKALENGEIVRFEGPIEVVGTVTIVPPPSAKDD